MKSIPAFFSNRSTRNRPDYLAHLFSMVLQASSAEEREEYETGVAVAAAISATRACCKPGCSNIDQARRSFSRCRRILR
jgi:hypothetical protein